MQNTILSIIVLALVAVGGYFLFTNYQPASDEAAAPSENVMEDVSEGDVSVHPISHATMVLEWDELVIYVDPVGGAEAFSGRSAPDIVFLTDIHGDHLDQQTLEAVVGDAAVIVAPQAVADMLPDSILAEIRVLANGEMTNINGLSVEAIPMYNLPESEDSRHVKGRGNGYVLEMGGTRLYIAGDTEDIPEMRALEDINIAFVPMNLPYTMDVDAAADAVLDFTPDRVYPYHYRGQDGLSDVGQFKEIVNAGNPDIEVVLLDWYPGQE